MICSVQLKYIPQHQHMSARVSVGAPHADVLVAHTDETIELRVFADGTCIEAFFLCGCARALALFVDFWVWVTV